MAKTKFEFDLDIQAKATISLLEHSKLQKMRKGESGVLFGRHKPNFKLMNATIEWTYDKDTGDADGLSKVTLSARYWGEIFLSKAIDKKSDCFKKVCEHEKEHQKVCVKALKASIKSCEAIIEKHTEKALQKYKGDYAAFKNNEATAAKNIAIAAYREIDDGPFYKAAVKSAALDTPANYKKIAPFCAAYG